MTKLMSCDQNILSQSSAEGVRLMKGILNEFCLVHWASNAFNSVPAVLQISRMFIKLIF